MQRSKRLWRCVCVLPVAAALLAGGCRGRENETAAIDIAVSDPEIAQARQQALATLPQFLAALQQPRPEQTLFAVKARFVDGDQVEYMWLTGLRYENGHLVGTLDNDPELVTNVARGDQHTIGLGEVEDWLILENDNRLGGYSIEVVSRRQDAGMERR